MANIDRVGADLTALRSTDAIFLTMTNAVVRTEDGRGGVFNIASLSVTAYVPVFVTGSGCTPTTGATAGGCCGVGGVVTCDVAGGGAGGAACDMSAHADACGITGVTGGLAVAQRKAGIIEAMGVAGIVDDDGVAGSRVGTAGVPAARRPCLAGGTGAAEGAVVRFFETGAAPKNAPIWPASSIKPEKSVRSAAAHAPNK